MGGIVISPAGSVALGVIVGLLSTTIQSVGLTLQRKSHLLEDEKEEDDHTRRPPYRRRRWQIGMLMFVVANLVGSTIQITTLPLPVLSTLQASGLVFNTICASLILSEPFTRYSAIGTVLVAAGAVLIGLFGAVAEPSHNLDQLLRLFYRKEFLLWLFGTLAIVVLVLIATWLFKRIYPRVTPRSKLFRGMAFGCASGILSAHTLLVAKSAVELLVRTIVDQHNQFNRWQSWIILIGLVALALLQLYYLHRGLKLLSTSVLYPFVFCVYNIVAILDGLIYFDQTSRVPVLHAVLVAIGTVILLLGVLALSWRLDHLEPSTTTDYEGHRRRRSTVGSRSRVVTPQTVLTPGLGFMHATENEPLLSDDESSTAVLDPDSVHPPQDEEAARPANETTPLLGRTTTTPSPHVAFRPSSHGSGTKRKGHTPSPLRVTRSRRTSAGDTSDIWDQLNDRDEHRKVSFGSKSPESSGIKRRRTLPAEPETVKQKKLRPMWLKGDDGDANGEEARHGNEAVESRDEGVEEGSEEIVAGQEERETGGWLKMRWWKKRRRDEGERGGDGDHGGG